MARPPKVALLIETSRSFGRGLVRGIANYSRVHGPWTFWIRPGDLDQELPSANKWQADGVIGRINTGRVARQIASRRLPVVCMGGDAYRGPRLVGTSQESLCRAAFEHLLERGFRRFAFCGEPHAWGRNREQIFRDVAGQAGYPCFAFPCARRKGGHAGDRVVETARWLAALPKPIGLLACDDLRGREVIDACHAAELAVPEEVAVVGIDNDELLCELAHPSLSSVALNAERIGYEAARILDQLMSGRSVNGWVEVEPLGVVARQSTDLLAIEDREVAAAVRFIREHAAEPVGVSDVLREVNVSRRTLEMRFLRALGRSPHAEIRRVQMERAKELLTRTDLKLSQVARRAGFRRAQYMHVLFRRYLKMTPAQYRKRQRAGGV
jgi:LacI family transcriptional regulator